MDQMMVDVTEIDEAAFMDEVVLVGKSGREEITVDDLSALSGRFNYEFLCDLDKRIPREYVKVEKSSSRSTISHKRPTAFGILQRKDGNTHYILENGV